MACKSYAELFFAADEPFDACYLCRPKIARKQSFREMPRSYQLLTGSIEAVVRAEAGRLPGDQSSLLPLLHAVQKEVGHVPDDAVPHIAAALNLSRAEVHGVITFYHDFRRALAGAHVIKLCRAEACQSRGGRAIEAALAARLGLAMGETRRDGQVSLEAVYCLGLCPTGPNALVDGRPVARLDAARIERIATQVGA